MNNLWVVYKENDFESAVLARDERMAKALATDWLNEGVNTVFIAPLGLVQRGRLPERKPTWVDTVQEG